MAEWLSHVLIAYALATLLSWRWSWITPQYKTLAMIGSFVPDLNRFELLISEHTVEALLGIPFSWSPLHFLSGSLLAVAIGSLLVAPRYRTRVFSVLALGVATHHAIDLFLVSLSGHSYSILWPLTQYAPPTPSLYLSTDRWPALVAGAVAGIVRLLDERSG
ncbi:metal-dependent hydrolase [Halalkalicoccus subterraneus]|uniref:metal-dependent hydrolase n=1 Tax=Halalkalicoccus subterraneus TaxID=2675002 RepID=UPI000EFB0269|nr:metal-dependent hydrolase [Halalkalicoccus subterraneus]